MNRLYQLSDDLCKTISRYENLCIVYISTFSEIQIRLYDVGV